MTAKTVSQLLTESRAAHRRYREAAGHIDRAGKVASAPNDTAARLAIVDAYNARLEAEALDPAHADAAWTADTVANNGIPSADLMAFYRSSFRA